ncbi:DUF5329 family protein [Hydrogenophaga sp. R2]|uniref:DUF5329 family protein n=1 Tax=Hydrogenophaga sp. R2 TaxID=3132827 RepID=UPI003CFADDDA
MKRRALLAAAALAVMARPAAAALPTRERERIEGLLEAMERQTDLQFERNGRRASSRDAVRFLRAKWERYGAEVDTAEAFIDRIASRSSTSGQPYRVCPKSLSCAEAGPWLRGLLQQLDERRT